MKIGIIIASINLWEKYTKPCIDSIKTKHDYRIVLVDNGSNDATYVEATKLIADNFHYKKNDDNWGCARAWNYGTRDSFQNGCDYILILNNDILLHPEAIDILVDRLEREKTNSGDRPVVMATCMNIQGDCQNPVDIFTKDLVAYKETEESEHPDFSAFMFNKDCWEKVGEFDEEFYPAYYEDNDYHYRINLAGLKAITCPPAIYYHYGSKTQQESSSRPVVNSMAFLRNRQYYIDKWGAMPGSETFKTPKNDPNKGINWVKQLG